MQIKYTLIETILVEVVPWVSPLNLVPEKKLAFGSF